MTSVRPMTLLALAATIAACSEQQDQTLPFDPAQQTTTTGTVPSTGGTVSLASGAQVQFPSGALSGSSQVIVARASATVPAGMGTPVGTSGVSVTSAAALTAPMQVELLVPGLGQQTDGWLADLAVVTPSGVEIAADAGVDLSNDRLLANVPTFGTLVPVIPPAADVQPVTSGIPAQVLPVDGAPVDLFTGPVRTISQNCRPFSPGSGIASVPRCAGLRAFASVSLLNQLGSARLVRPRVEGTITLTGDPRVAPGATAAGTIVMRAVVRVRQSGAAGGFAGRIPVTVTLTAGANARVTQSTVTVGTSSISRLALTNFTASVSPSFGQASAPASFNIDEVTPTSGEFVYTGTINLGNNATGQVQVRFPFTIGY